MDGLKGQGMDGGPWHWWRVRGSGSKFSGKRGRSRAQMLGWEAEWRGRGYRRPGNDWRAMVEDPGQGYLGKGKDSMVGA